MRRAMIVLAGLLLTTAALASPASAGWNMRGSFEPDTPHDDGFMWDDPDQNSNGFRIYFNAVAHFAGAGANPNNAVTGSRVYPGGFQGWYAYLGVWKDCNRDGYMGLQETGALEYPSRVYSATGSRVCDLGSMFNDGQWVREFLWIAPRGAVGDHDLDGDTRDDAARYVPGVLIEDDWVKVWGDYGLPGAADVLCPLLPSRGTTASTGALIGHADCHANRRVANNLGFVETEITGPIGLAFEDAEHPERSETLLNQDSPASLWGNPNDGQGQGGYRGGLLEDGRKAGGSDPNPAFSVYDCSSRFLVVLNPTSIRSMPNDPTTASGQSLLGGPIGPTGNSVTVWDEQGRPVDDPLADGEVYSGGALHNDLTFTNWMLNLAQDPTGFSYYDALQNAYDGTADECDTEDDDDFAFLSTLEGRAAQTNARRENDIVFLFQANPSTTPEIIRTAAGDGASYDLGTGTTRTTEGVGWVGYPQSLTAPQLFRQDARPSGAQYASFYTYISNSILNQGIGTPGGTGVYGSESCTGDTTGVSNGWDCNKARWFTDTAGGDTMPQQAFGPDAYQPHRSPWGGSRPAGARVHEPYNMRDVDCFDGTLIDGTPAYLSLQYFTDDDSCKGTGGGQFQQAWTAVPELDEDFNGLGDTYQNKYRLSRAQVEDALNRGTDFDGDGAGLLQEFKWNTIPIAVLDPIEKSRDFDSDSWLDGDEIRYWNTNQEPLVPVAGGVAYRDPDSFDDSDNDTLQNQHDPDSDNDGLIDGDEVHTYATYPEFSDSDCAIGAPCPDPRDTKFRAPDRPTSSGDLIPDAEEIEWWIDLLGPPGYLMDCDDDGIPNIRDVDSDDDGSTDGQEHADGTDPCEADPADLSPVARADPSNEDLPVLDPTNRQYLEEGRVDGTVEPAEERVDDTITTFASDYLIDQLNRGAGTVVETAEAIIPDTTTTVLDPVLYGALETLQTAPSPEQLVKTVTRTAWTATDGILATCGLNLLDTDATQPEPTVDRATACVSQVAETATTAAPLLGETLNSTLGVPSSTLATLTTTLEYASAIVDQTLQDPLGAIAATATPVTSDVEHQAQPIIDVIPPPPTPINLNPKNLADNLGLVYDTIMQTGPNPANAKDAAISTADSAFYNVYVANDDASRSWTYLNVALANLTRIDADGNTSTGINGTDLMITSTPTLSGDDPGARLTNLTRSAPTLRVQALTPAARNMPLIVCGFYQLPGVPYVAANCLDTRNQTLATNGATTPSAGFPTTANLTTSAYSFGEDLNVTATLRLESTTTHANLPLLAAGSIFQVDVTQHAKPRVKLGDHADATLWTSDAKDNAEFTLRRTSDAKLGAASEWSWSTSTRSDLNGSYALTRANRTLTASSTLTDPPSTLEIRADRDAADAALTITTRALPPTQLPGVTFAVKDTLNTSATEAFSLEADLLPATLVLNANDTAGTISLTTDGGALGALKLVATNKRDLCPALTTDNQITRQPADAERGACLTLDLRSPVRSLNIDLASGGPSLALTSSTSTNIPFGAMVLPGGLPVRSLDALLSQTPTALSLRSSLAQIDGSTSLVWTASELVEDVRVQAESGPTLLRWNATDIPTAVQALYQWSADAITVSTSTPNAATVEFLLTNTGSVPTLPTGDYIAGVREANGRVEASAFLSGVSEFRSTLATQDFRIDATGGVGEPFGLRYARDLAPAFTLDVTPLPAGSLSLRSSAKDGGTHRIDYSSGSRGNDLAWVGDFPEGTHTEGDIADAPQTFTFTTNPTAGTLAFDASGDRAGRFSTLHARSGASAATLEGDSVVHMRSIPGGADTYRVSLLDASSFTLAKTKGDLVVTSSQAIEHPLRIEIVNGETQLAADASTLPPTVSLLYGRTGIEYAASASTPPDWDMSVKENGDTIVFNAERLPTQARIVWASSTQASSLTATHDAERVPLLHAEAELSPTDSSTGSEFVKVHLEDSPPSVTAMFDRAKDEITASAGPTPVGVVVYQHAANADSIQVPEEPNHALAHRTGTGAQAAYEALRMESMSTLQIRLGSQAAQTNQLLIEANTQNPFYAEYDTSTGDTLRVRLSNIPSRTDLIYALNTNQGDTNATGFKVTQASLGPIGSVSLHAEQAGRALTLEAANVPTDWRVAWAPAQPFDLRANAEMTLSTLAYRPVGDPIATMPGRDAYLFVDASDPTAPRIAAAFPSGVTRARSDAAQRETRVELAPHSTFGLFHRDVGITTMLDATSPATSFTLRAPPASEEGRTTLRWTSIGATSKLDWGVDSPDARWRWHATDVPTLVTARLDPAAGTFVTNAPAGVGSEFKLQYANAADQPFYGTNAGLVLVSTPSGSEDYPATATTFTLDLPDMRSASASFTGTNVTADGIPSFGAELRRTNGALPTSATIALVAGPEALRVSANDVADVFDTSWMASPTSGFEGSLVATGLVRDLVASYRGKEGFATTSVSEVTDRLTIRLSPKAEGGDSAVTKMVDMAYENAANAANVNVFIDAAGALANLAMTNAPREFHAQAPLECATTGATGRAWASPGESAGEAHLVVVPRDAPPVPVVAELYRLVATCETNAATLQLDLPGLQQASWTIEPADGLLDADLTLAGSPSAARFLLTADQRNLVLDAGTNRLPSNARFTGSSTGTATRVAWVSSEWGADTSVVYLTPQGTLNASVTSAPTDWALSADASAPTPLHYTASGPAWSLLADVTAAGFSAHVDATDVPPILAWTVPLTSCPTPTQSLAASVSTRGTGSIGRLTSWTLPGSSGDFVDTAEDEHAILACDDNGARSSVSMTGVEEIRWTQTVPPGVALAPAATSVSAARASTLVGPAGPDGPRVSPPGGLGSQTMELAFKRDAGKADQGEPIQSRYDAADGQSWNVTSQSPTVSLGVTFGAGSQLVTVGLAQDGASPAAVYAQHASEGVTRTGSVFTRPAGSGLLTIDGRADPLRIDYQASGDSESFVVATADAGPHVWLSASGGVPSRLVGSVSGGLGADCSGASAPVSATFSTLGSGSVGRVFAQVSDDRAPPGVDAEGGAAYVCPDGKTRGFAASLPELTEFELSGGPCVARVIAPADSLHETPVRIQTSSFDAGARVRMAPLADGTPTAALVVVGFGEGGFGFHAEGTTNVLGSVVLDFLRLDGGDPTSGGSLPCMAFGKGSVNRLHADATIVIGDLDAQIGKDADQRRSIHVEGGGAETLQVEIQTSPPPNANEGSAAATDDPTHVAVGVVMPVGMFNLQYLADGGGVPSIRSQHLTQNYAYAGMTPEGVKGGRIQLLGFRSASLMLDRDLLTKKTSAAVVYESDSEGAPLAVVAFSADGSEIAVSTGGLPSRMTATFDLASVLGGFEGGFTYDATGTTSLAVDQSMGGGVDATLDIPIVPSQLATRFRFLPQLHDLFLAEVNSFTASQSTSLIVTNRVSSGTRFASSMKLDLIDLPTQFTGSYRQLACGAEIKMNAIAGGVGRVNLDYDTTGTNDDTPATQVDQMCPRAASSDASGKAESMRLTLGVSSIPQGALSAVVRTGGKAGATELWSTGGPIGHVELRAHMEGDETATITISADSVTIKAANWDIDGDTRFEGSPKSLYANSGGATIGRFILDVKGDKNFRADTRGRAILDEFQFRLSLRLQVAGCLKLPDWQLNAPNTWMSIDFPGALGVIGQPYVLSKGGEWGRC